MNKFTFRFWCIVHDSAYFVSGMFMRLTVYSMSRLTNDPSIYKEVFGKKAGVNG